MEWKGMVSGHIKTRGKSSIAGLVMSYIHLTVFFTCYLLWHKQVWCPRGNDILFLAVVRSFLIEYFLAMSKSKAETKVLVSGASGFIATHVIQLLLKNGYHVRGTVRDLHNEKKIRPLKELYPPAQKNLDLVEADLLKPESWEKAVEGCTYVLHVASPFPNMEPSDPNEILRPAIDGTLAVLRAAHKEGVKRVVLTSSAVAILGEGSLTNEGLNEEHWTKMEDNVSTYTKSKALAEKAAWDFVKEHGSFELAVINPGLVFGPVLHDTDCTSGEVVIRMLQLKIPMVPDLWYTGVDVRDVAEAHMKAMILPQAAGQRFGLGARLISFLEVSQILKQEFGPQGYWISTAPAPYWGVWLASFVDKGGRLLLKDIGRKYHMDCKKMQTVLGIKPIDMKKSIIDTGYSVIERGFVKKTSGYKGPRPESS